MTQTAERCACGCGKLTKRRARLLLAQYVQAARALEWEPYSVRPMCDLLPCVRGHEGDIEGYVGGEGEQP